MSLGALDPRSVSEGWMDSNTPATSPVAASTWRQRQQLNHNQPTYSRTMHTVYQFKVVHLPCSAAHLCDVEHDRSLESCCVLYVLSLQLLLVSCGWQGLGTIVSRGCTASLRVEEGRSTVGWHGKVTSELARGSRGSKLLDGEQEGDTLASWRKRTEKDGRISHPFIHSFIHHICTYI